jgi:hypothetical protein
LRPGQTVLRGPLPPFARPPCSGCQKWSARSRRWKISSSTLTGAGARAYARFLLEDGGDADLLARRAVGAVTEFLRTLRDSLR